MPTTTASTLAQIDLPWEPLGTLALIPVAVGPQDTARIYVSKSYGWDGNLNRGSVRVHRGRNHLIAVSSNPNGGNSILRLRYNDTGRSGSFLQKMSVQNIGKISIVERWN